MKKAPPQHKKVSLGKFDLKNRYFVLSGNMLQYYDTKERTKHCGDINLQEVISLERISDPKQFKFSLSTAVCARPTNIVKHRGDIYRHVDALCVLFPRRVAVQCSALTRKNRNRNEFSY
jgi:hypothetical protein